MSAEQDRNPSVEDATGANQLSLVASPVHASHPLTREQHQARGVLQVSYKYMQISVGVIGWYYATKSELCATLMYFSFRLREYYLQCTVYMGNVKGMGMGYG